MSKSIHFSTADKITRVSLETKCANCAPYVCCDIAGWMDTFSMFFDSLDHMAQFGADLQAAAEAERKKVA